MEDKSSRRCSLFRVVILSCVIAATIGVQVWVARNCGQTCPKSNKTVKHPSKVSAHSNEDWDYNWDFKAWKDPNEAKGVATRTIILVRHGQFTLKSGLLNDKGLKQANYTGLRLREFNVPFDRIIHSDLDRASMTAKIIHRYLPDVPVTQDVMLDEGGPIPPQPTISYWSLPKRNYFVDGPRLEAAFRKYFYRADKTQTTRSREILVGHGNTFRYFLLRALQLPRTAWMRVYLPHASISRIYINPDGTVTCDMFGDAGHIPASLVTL